MQKYYEYCISFLGIEPKRCGHRSLFLRVIVNLWCIQTNPSARPSMTKVVQMLEGSLESLQIPPKPFLFSITAPPDFSSTFSSPYVLYQRDEVKVLTEVLNSTPS